MRQLMLAGAAALLALVAACAPQTVETTPPTVTLAYDDEDDYDEVAMRADEYCAERYGTDAVLLERDAEDGAYQATFSCE